MQTHEQWYQEYEVAKKHASEQIDQHLEWGYGMQHVMRSLIDEYFSARDKHGPMTMDGERAHDLHRITALTEELGEVASALTYDDGHDKRATLRKELIQVANLALTWASILPEDE